MQAVKHVAGEAGQIGSSVKLIFAEDDCQIYRLTAFTQRSISFEVIKTNPFVERGLNSISATIELQPISDCNQTFVKWTHTFSNKSDEQSIIEKIQEKKKLFAEMKSSFEGQ